MAERLSGRPMTLRTLLDRGRGLFSHATARWDHLVEAGLGVRDAWHAEVEEAEEDEELEEEFDAELDEDLDDMDDEDLDEDDEDLEDDDEDLDDDDEDLEDDDEDLEDDDEDLEDDDEDLDDDDEDLEDEEEPEDEAEFDPDALDARVLEAFSNDPVLAERAVQIECTDDDAIVLHGRVNSAREVAHAVTIARGVPGVAAVRQHLTFRDRR